MTDWEALAPRLDPRSNDRWSDLESTVSAAAASAGAQRGLLSQWLIGGYMFLRVLAGPADRSGNFPLVP